MTDFSARVCQLCLLVSLFLFVWKVELMLVTVDIAEATFRNGFWKADGEQVYHLLMYFCFFSVFWSFFVIERLKQ